MSATGTVHERHAALIRKAVSGDMDAMYEALRVEAPHIDWPEVQPLLSENGRIQAARAATADTVTPLFDVEAARFGRFMASDPPARRMIVPDFLPLDIVGLLAAMGGAGKSVLLYQLGISVATGVRFLGMPLSEVGSVLYLAAEDDEHELHRRGRRILEHVQSLGPVDSRALNERLIVQSRVSEDNLLTTGREGEVVRTQLVQRLIATARQLPDLKLIAIDPVSRFRGGKANAEEDTTRFVEALEVVRAETGATVLAAVHVNKASIRDGGDADQSIVRGSSALPDGVRWCATMTRLRRDVAKDYGLDEGEVDRYVRIDLPKTNYTAPWPGLWMRREAGGVLAPTSLQRKAESRAQERVATQYQDVLERIVALLLKEGPLTPRRLETEFAGTAGVLAAGQKTVRAVVYRAVHEGALIEQDNIGKGGGRTVTVPGGAADA